MNEAKKVGMRASRAIRKESPWQHQRYEALEKEPWPCARGHEAVGLRSRSARLEHRQGGTGRRGLEAITCGLSEVRRGCMVSGREENGWLCDLGLSSYWF